MNIRMPMLIAGLLVCACIPTAPAAKEDCCPGDCCPDKAAPPKPDRGNQQEACAAPADAD